MSSALPVAAEVAMLAHLAIADDLHPGERCQRLDVPQRPGNARFVAGHGSESYRTRTSSGPTINGDRHYPTM